MVHERARRSRVQGLAALLAPLAICLLVIAVVSTRIMAPAQTVDDPLLDFAMGRGAPPPEQGDKLRQRMANMAQGRERGNNAPSTREGTGMTKERGWVPPGLDDDAPPRDSKLEDEEVEDGDIESADAFADEAPGEDIESEDADGTREEDSIEMKDSEDDDDEEEPSRGREMSEDSGVGEELPPSRDEEIEAEIAEEEEGRVDDDDYDPLRPRKNPRGKRWRGWPNARRPGDKLGARTKRNAKGGKDREGATNRNDSNRDPPKLPRSTGNDWWRKSSLCFEVDYICHGQAKNEWFYYAPPSESDDTDEAPFQPTMELKSAPAKYDGGKDRGETRISIKVSSSSKVDLDEKSFKESERFFLTSNKKGSDSKCEISSAPTHIVLQWLFNDMVGEFYSRTLLRLYNFMTEGLDWNERGGKLPWEENVQFYVHIPYGNKKIVDGHKLLLSGMLSDPESPVAKSLVDLFVQEENADESSSSDCQCYEKMVFCGYDVYTHPTDVKSKDLEPAVDDDDVSAEQNSEPGDASSRDVKYTLWSAGKLDHSSELDAGSCGRNAGEKGTEYECQEWRGLRDFLSTNFAKHYPTLDRDIAVHRQQQLLKVGAIGADYEGDTKEFTVIGLAQRTYRRAWVNLPQIIDECNAASFERVICVEVNVEKTATPFEQLLLHRSLDVMIGVHGAQMTQAILLPKHAHVLELLPWITDYIRGKWVQTTHGPTPLGVIFHNTDLNHAGYSLDRSSVPLCEGAPKEAEQTCFMRQRKKFIWENRDFTVESAAVMQYIKQFVLFVRDKQRPCDELKHRLDERFVLYNVWCTKPKLWYPMERDGEQACVHGADYPMDHTDELLKGTHLFDSRSKCCSANPEACPSHAKAPKLESSGNTFGVFHAYRKPPPKQKAKNVLTKLRRGRKKRIRNQ